MAKAYGLTEKDVLLLKDMAAWYRQRVGNRARIQNLEYDALPGPDGEIVLAPAGGIPPLTPGTPDEPGAAECQVFDVVEEELIESSASPLIVYNVSESEIPEGSYALVRRTRRGLWVVDQPGTGGDVSIPYETDTVGSDYSLTTTPTSIVDVQLTEAGTYLFMASMGWYVQTVVGAGGERIFFTLNDATNSVSIVGNVPLFGRNFTVTEVGRVEFHIPFAYGPVGGTYPATIELKVWHGAYNGSGPNTSWITSGSGPAGPTRLTRIKLN